MNKLTKIAAASVVALGLGMAGQAQAHLVPFIIDDFNFTTGSSVEDTTADGSGVSGPPGTGGIVMGAPDGPANPWQRTDLFANKTFPPAPSTSAVGTEDCAFCQQGHFTNEANTTGHGAWDWVGPSLNLSGYNTFMLDIQTDVPNADIVVTFTENGVSVGEIWWKDLPDTNLATLTLSGSLAGMNLLDVTDIHLDAFSVGDVYDPQLVAGYNGPVTSRNFGLAATALDLNVDNAKAVPEPGTIALLGLGLAGLGWSQRRRIA